MSIAAGLSATKTGFDLIKSARELLARPDVNRDEVQQRLLELQALMLEAQKALGDAEDENRRLREQLVERRAHQQLADDLEIVDDGKFFVRKSEVEAGKPIPYCPICWGVDQKLVPLRAKLDERVLECAVHEALYYTRAYREEARGVQSGFGAVGRPIFDPNKQF